MSVRLRTASVLSALSVVACAARTPGTRPHDASVAGHELMLAHEEREAEAHEARYDPEAAQRRTRCLSGSASATEPCWSSVTNPTAEHLKHAEEHRARAAEHRAASRALRDAEARACRGIPADDRDESPFARREDIARVAPLHEPLTPKLAARRLVGVEITFRAVPGLTAAWLQRVVECHLARNAALGHEANEMAYCPLVPDGLSARVREDGPVLTVEIRSAHERTAREIVRRAELLAK